MIHNWRDICAVLQHDARNSPALRRYVRNPPAERNVGVDLVEDQVLFLFSGHLENTPVSTLGE